ncbi:hypothetical protein SPLC1_S031990 [Arthrospira platensis C1]|nr:hypothetical protein SPLC1_S031990 [Arthrospira platensis C1]
MLKPTNQSLSIVNPQPPRNPHHKAIAPIGTAISLCDRF